MSDRIGRWWAWVAVAGLMAIACGGVGSWWTWGQVAALGVVVALAASYAAGCADEDDDEDDDEPWPWR